MTLPKRLVGCLAIVGALVVLLLVVSIVFAVVPGSWPAADRVAVLPVEGVITSDEEFREELDRFLDDSSVRAIVVRINSPGGSVAPSQSIYQELRDAREAGVPVIASIGSVGASGGYYVALAADTILALPGSITGSIGVIMQLPNTEELMDKVGVSVEIVKSSEHKDLGSPFRPLGEKDRAILESMVDDVYDQFVAVIKAERGLSDTQLRGLADGRVLSGRQAVEAGLVDRTGNLSDAISLAGRMSGLGDDPEVVRPPEPRPSLLDVILGARTSALVERLGSEVARLEGPRLRYMVH